MMKLTPISITAHPARLCHFCAVSLRQIQPNCSTAASPSAFAAQHRQFWQYSPPCRNRLSPRATKKSSPPSFVWNIRSASSQHPRSTSYSKEIEVVERAKTLCNAILDSDTIPTDEATLHAFAACEAAARQLMNKDPATRIGSESPGTPASSLLSLEDSPTPSKSDAIDMLSNLAYSLFQHPNVFITPEILALYVATQSLLQRPQSFPEAFDLYAQKPTPVPGSSPPKYRDSNPNKAAAAIPSELANAALTAAIDAKDLPLALDIIETTFRAPAFRRAKVVKRLLPPVLGLSLAPVAAYAVALRWSDWQGNMDPSTATGIAFAGLLTYVGATATVGVVAVTTANDQMDRVTWATGMPLRERWLREEERAAIDRLASAWGFEEKWKRGEEEGEEWDNLREWIGWRGMVLDKAELMEGME